MTPAAQLLNLVNAARAELGRPALAANAMLWNAAQELANWIAKTGIVDHWDFEGRLVRSGYRAAAKAENAALAYSLSQTVDLWLRSLLHRRHLLDNYPHAGVGVAPDRRGRLACVILFAAPAREGAA